MNTGSEDGELGLEEISKRNAGILRGSENPSVVLGAVVERGIGVCRCHEMSEEFHNGAQPHSLNDLPSRFRRAWSRSR
jgi:hypothetical protein